MIKTMILASFLMAFTFIAIPTTSAQAHCGKGCGEKAQQQKPCEKCLKAGKPCKCASKKPCEKHLGKKPCEKHLGKKPCTKNLGATNGYTSSVDHSAKGSLTLKSKYGRTGGTASYN